MVNTPLSTLNADLCVPQGAATEWEPDLQCYVAAANAVTPGQDHSVYTANMDQSARAIAAHVQSHLSFAKNVVKPVITEIVECFTQRVNTTNISPLNDFKLVKKDLPEPMLNSDIKDAIDDYADIEVATTPVVNFNAPEKNILELVELMKTGSKTADAAIDAWVATVGDAEILAAYGRMFGAQNLSSTYVNPVGITPASWNSTLAVFLMARNLHDKPWEGCAMSLVNYNVAIGNLRDLAGNTLAAIYRTYSNDIKTGVLISSMFNNTVEVFAPVYNEWIAAGNNDLILFGAAVRNQRLVFVSEVNDKKVELMKAWELHCAMAAASERNRKYTIMKRALYDCVFQVVEGNAQSVFGHLKSDDSTVDHVTLKEYKTFKEAFEVYYGELTEAHFTDIWATAKEIVCNQLFYYTDANEILTGIEDACKNNPDMPVDEAALLSTIRYVCKYVSSQMVLSKI